MVMTVFLMEKRNKRADNRLDGKCLSLLIDICNIRIGNALSAFKGPEDTTLLS